MKKSIMILILIGIYILYLYKKYIYKKKQEMALNQIVEEVSSKVQNISTVDLRR